MAKYRDLYKRVAYLESVLFERELDLPNSAEQDIIDDLFSGDISLVKTAIESGVDINKLYNIESTDDQTPLLWYASKDDYTSLKIVQLLLKNGADVDNGNSIGVTPLMQACHEGSEETAALLLKYNANVEAKDSDGRTAIFYAVTRHVSPSDDFVKMLYKAGADLDATNNFGHTPLTVTWSIQKDNFRPIYRPDAKLLLELGANVDCLYEYVENDAIVDAALKSIGYSK